MEDLTKKNLTEIVSLIKKKEIKSEELTLSFIKNIDKDKMDFSLVASILKVFLMVFLYYLYLSLKQQVHNRI